MKKLPSRSGAPPGFRMDAVDAIFIGLLILLAAGIRAKIGNFGGFWFIPLYLGLSFFLFCNVFRIGNRLEPIWYLPFTLLMAACIYAGRPDLFWWLTLIALEPLKWMLIAYRLIKGPYVGIGCARFRRIASAKRVPD